MNRKTNSIPLPSPNHSNFIIRQPQNSNYTIISRNYHLQLYLCLQIAVNAILMTNQEDLQTIQLANLIGSVVIAFIGILFTKRIKHLHSLILLTSSKLLTITTLIVMQNYLLLPFSLIFLNFDLQLEEENQLTTHIQKILVIFSLLVIVIIFQRDSFLISIMIATTILQMKQSYFAFRGNKIQEATISKYETSKLIQMNESMRHRESIWKNRVEQIPLSILMVSRGNLKISFKNLHLYSQFTLFKNDEEELENLIMNELQFQLVPEHLEQFQTSSLNVQFKKKKPRNAFDCKSPQFAQSSLSDFMEQQGSTLNSILANFKSGIYLNYRNSKNLFIEIYCHQFIKEYNLKFEISGYVIDSDIDDEIIITLNDMTKWNQLQAYIVKDDFKSKIIESFQHELRTPLNSATNFLTSCLNDPQLDPLISQNCIQPALSSLRLQSFLISDIIDFSQYHTNNLNLQLREFTVQELVTEISKLFQIQLEMKNIGFNADLIENSLEYLCTDYNRLMQIIINILQNSLKFSPFSGQIILKISSYSLDYLKIVIKDVGHGIEQQKLSQIKQILIDVDQGRDFSNQKQWNGFGLLITAILVNNLGPEGYKQLSVKSDGIGLGTKVSFYVQNHQLKSSGYRQNTIRHTINSNKLISYQNLQAFNGTIIVTGELASQKNKKSPNEKVYNKKSTPQSAENSMFSQVSLQSGIDQRMQELDNLQPQLITNIKFKRKDTMQSKVIHFRQLLQSFEMESEEFIKSIHSKKKRCTCNKILSVDDEVFNQKSIQMLIQRLGFEVLLEYNGEQAIDLVKTMQRCSPNCQLFVLILMDYQMPIMDGISTTKYLRELMENKIIPQIHIVGLTAFTNSNDIQNCINAGMSDVLAKPLNLQELKDILQLI